MSLAKVNVRKLLREHRRRVRLEPDPHDAAQLERKRQALQYRPTEGFLLDRQQERKDY